MPHLFRTTLNMPTHISATPLFMQHPRSLSTHWCSTPPTLWFTCTMAAGIQSLDDSAAASAPSLPPQLDHTYVITHAQRRVDTLRRTIHALDAQRVLVFMNYQHRLKVRATSLELRGG